MPIAITSESGQINIQNLYNQDKVNTMHGYAFFLSFLFFSFFFCLFRAALGLYGSSQARDQIGDATASLCHSHSNVRFKVCLRPTLHLMAMSGSLTH